MSCCLRLTLLKVPVSRPAGFDVKLSCHIDLEGDVLYTIRWFHNDKEFYRFSPNEEPNVMFFPKKGIYIDVRQSLILALLSNVQKYTGVETLLKINELIQSS